ncbi:MAG: hypothetical protein J6C92_07055 [Bacteroidaceae bacterium]|nr:hypothetical protein [Bacteroidaceae bacterium]
MITNKKKNEKTTEIYFDETPSAVVIRTHNTALKKRLLAFSEEFPSLCRLTDDDELGYLSFEIDKARFSIRLTAPYTEERKALARAKMIVINNKEEIG